MPAAHQQGTLAGRCDGATLLHVPGAGWCGGVGCCVAMQQPPATTRSRAAVGRACSWQSCCKALAGRGVVCNHPQHASEAPQPPPPPPALAAGRGAGGGQPEQAGAHRRPCAGGGRGGQPVTFTARSCPEVVGRRSLMLSQPLAMLQALRLGPSGGGGPLAGP